MIGAFRHRRVPRSLVLVIGALALLGGGCGHGAAPRVVLDGRPRVPDVEGVVERVSFTSLELDGGRRYTITRDLQCFSTSTMQAVPLLDRQDQYVQAGVEGRRVVWLAAIGAVVPGTPRAVYYRGELVRVDSASAVFRDGTVLRLTPGVRGGWARRRGSVLARIDPDRHVVVEMSAS